MSASNCDALFTLRCNIREGMVDRLQRAHPEALPRWRFEPPQLRADEELVWAGNGRDGARQRGPGQP